MVWHIEYRLCMKTMQMAVNILVKEAKFKIVE